MDAALQHNMTELSYGVRLRCCQQDLASCVRLRNSNSMERPRVGQCWLIQCIVIYSTTRFVWSNLVFLSHTTVCLFFLRVQDQILFIQVNVSPNFLENVTQDVFFLEGMSSDWWIINLSFSYISMRIFVLLIKLLNRMLISFYELRKKVYLFNH
jgi:hypothetical protein